MAKKKNSSWSLWLFVVIIIGLFILPVWMVESQIWPASLLIELQAKMFSGKYYPRATGAVIFILLVFVLLLTGVFISWVKNKLNKKQ